MSHRIGLGPYQTKSYLLLAIRKHALTVAGDHPKITNTQRVINWWLGREEDGGLSLSIIASQKELACRASFPCSVIWTRAEHKRSPLSITFTSTPYALPSPPCGPRNGDTRANSKQVGTYVPKQRCPMRTCVRWKVRLPCLLPNHASKSRPKTFNKSIISIKSSTLRVTITHEFLCTKT